MKTTTSILLTAGLTLLSAWNVMAQDATKILNELSHKAKSYSTIYAEYSSRLLDKTAGVDMQEKGKIHVKGNKYNLDLPSYNVISDGKNVWTYEKENNSVYIDLLEDIQDGGMDPSQMFTIWETGFKNEFKETKTENGREVYVINLYPNNPKEKAFHTIQLFIDKAKMEVSKIVVMNRDGSTVSYTVSVFTPNKTLSDSTFTFDKGKHPGVEVIDNRL